MLKKAPETICADTIGIYNAAVKTKVSASPRQHQVTAKNELTPICSLKNPAKF
jgi:hypothetical protein